MSFSSKFSKNDDVLVCVGEKQRKEGGWPENGRSLADRLTVPSQIS